MRIPLGLVVSFYRGIDQSKKTSILNVNVNVNVFLNHVFSETAKPRASFSASLLSRQGCQKTWQYYIYSYVFSHRYLLTGIYSRVFNHRYLCGLFTHRYLLTCIDSHHRCLLTFIYLLVFTHMYLLTGVNSHVYTYRYLLTCIAHVRQTVSKIAVSGCANLNE